MDGIRADRNRADPDLGVLAGRLLAAVRQEMFGLLAAEGFDDLSPRQGSVLAHLRPEGVRATELARLSGQHKQVIGTMVDELTALGYVERTPDPADRRAKLIRPTERGLSQMRTADRIMARLQDRHAERLGAGEFSRFKAILADVIEHQRRHAAPAENGARSRRD